MWWGMRRFRGRPRGKARYYNRNRISHTKKMGKLRMGFHLRKKRIQKRPNRGYRNLHTSVRVSPALAAIINKDEATRPEIVKALWLYAKTNKLQVKDNGRMIVPDKTLATVMGHEGEQVHGFTMIKLVRNHLNFEEQPAEEEKGGTAPAAGEEKGGNTPAAGEEKGGNTPAAGEEKGGNTPAAGEEKGGNTPAAGEEKGGNTPAAGEEKGGNTPATGEEKGGTAPAAGEEKGGIAPAAEDKGEALDD